MDKQRIPCHKCKNIMEVDQAPIEIINQLTCSMLFINHGMCKDQLRCRICGTEHFLGINQFQLSAIGLAVIPVPPKEEASRIIMPN